MIIKSYSRLILHAIPSLLAIILIELVNIQVYVHGPLSKHELLLLGWLVLQMIPGFVFGYISDRHYRRVTLIVTQIFGFIGGILLSVFGFEIWVLVLIALTFNPMPVARAAFIDNFPQYSLLKLIAITFLAQFLPWAFFDIIAPIDPKYFVFFILGILGLNILLTIFWFKDDYDRKMHEHVSLRAIKTKVPILLTLTAFTLAETTFYITWSLFEETPSLQNWQAIIQYATLIGILISMLYKRLPHFSVITLFYSIGAGMLLTVLLRCGKSHGSDCSSLFINAMSYYSVIGGLYLSFVTVAVIELFGPRYKGVGSAMIEFGDTIATFIAPLITLILKLNILGISITVTLLYIVAAITQRRAEYTLAILQNKPASKN
jgi:MFS family permease